MHKFQAPVENLGSLSGPVAADLLAAAADIALVIDARGVIRDLSLNNKDLADRGLQKWIGKPWVDTVTVESRVKISELLGDEQDGRTLQRHVNHPDGDGPDLPVLYSAVPLGEKGHRVAIGKDLSALAHMQQRLVNVQQSMERDYSRLRQYETRYRLLFQSSSEAILFVQASDLRVLEANAAAADFLGAAERKLIGSNLLRWFDTGQRQQLEDELAALRVNGNSRQIALLTSPDQRVQVQAALFKADNNAQLLLRFETEQGAEGQLPTPETDPRLASLVAQAPDGWVFADTNGRILAANTEFLDIAQLASFSLAEGQLLSGWLGQSGIDFQIILSSLREHGILRLYATEIRGEFGSITDVEVSAVSVSAAGEEGLGFAIRNVSRRVSSGNDQSSMVPRSIDQLTQLVGRVPLKELVRESTELIEQLCIQAALKLTGNNRASAAEMLGLSRQSLYVKLRRYSLEDDENDSAA